MAEHNLLGKKGEDIAAAYLIKNGYHILERSWKYKYLELDIIATYDNRLVVVEVKTRSQSQHADPDDTVSKKKLLQIYECTDIYMELKGISSEVRYDLITIIDHGDTHTLEHIEDAFYPFMNF